MRAGPTPYKHAVNVAAPSHHGSHTGDEPMLDRLSRADRFSGAGAVLALSAGLLPWYHFTDGTSQVTTNGLGTGFCGDVVFLAGAAMLLVLLVRHGVISLRHSLDDQRIDNVIGAAALAAALLQLLIGVNGSGAFHHAAIGLGVGIAAGVSLCIGAVLRAQERSQRRSSMRRR